MIYFKIRPKKPVPKHISRNQAPPNKAETIHYLLAPQNNTYPSTSSENASPRRRARQRRKKPREFALHAAAAVFSDDGRQGSTTRASSAARALMCGIGRRSGSNWLKSIPASEIRYAALSSRSLPRWRRQNAIKSGAAILEREIT